jgi:hypothetical protein
MATKHSGNLRSLKTSSSHQQVKRNDSGTPCNMNKKDMRRIGRRMIFHISTIPSILGY